MNNSIEIKEAFDKNDFSKFSLVERAIIQLQNPDFKILSFTELELICMNKSLVKDKKEICLELMFDLAKGSKEKYETICFYSESESDIHNQSLKEIDKFNLKSSKIISKHF